MQHMQITDDATNVQNMHRGPWVALLMIPWVALLMARDFARLQQ